MKRDFDHHSSESAGRLWRWTLIALSTLILCSCRGRGHLDAPYPGPGPQQPPLGCEQPHGGLLPNGGPPPGLAYAPLASQVLNAPAEPEHVKLVSNDEYICDGGDSALPVQVTPDWRLYGLDREDTIAHYESLDGRTFVHPSNKVCVYSPRFAAVRTVRSVVEDEQVHGPAGVMSPVGLEKLEETRIPVVSTQPVRPQADVGRRVVGAYATRWGDGVVSTALVPRGLEDLFSPFEDLAIIRRGVFEQVEGTRLAAAVLSANVWINVQRAQVIIDDQRAVELATVQTPAVTYTIDEGGPIRFRLVKVASKQEALPGETVDFTLRFDNVGGQVIGNIVIVDHLHQRLELIPESVQSSIPTTFTTEEDEFGSLVLRWEVTDPLEAGKGGIVRFQCRMR